MTQEERELLNDQYKTLKKLNDITKEYIELIQKLEQYHAVEFALKKAEESLTKGELYIQLLTLRL